MIPPLRSFINRHAGYRPQPKRMKVVAFCGLLERVLTLLPTPHRTPSCLVNSLRNKWGRSPRWPATLRSNRAKNSATSRPPCSILSHSPPTGETARRARTILLLPPLENDPHPHRRRQRPIVLLPGRPPPNHPDSLAPSDDEFLSELIRSIHRAHFALVKNLVSQQ